MNTYELKELLRNTYKGHAYAILWEVGNATGTDCTRHADAMVMSLWPSRGLDLMGCELKVSRGDWLKELKNPGKAEVVLQFCDLWFIVAGDETIVIPDELPKGWGLMIPNGRGTLKVKVKACPLAPKPLDRSFLAAIMRRVCEQSADKEEIAKAKDEAYRRGTETAERSRKYDSQQLTQLREHVRAFEAASGLTIEHGWGGGEKIGSAVKAVMSGEIIGNHGLRKARNLAAAFVRDADVLLPEGEI